MLLYIHIPFCRRKCRYCGFVSFENRINEAEAYFRNILKEAELRRDEFSEPVETLYIGGGTPSVVPAETMAGFLHSFCRDLIPHPLREATIEANPGTLKETWLHAVQEEGINRLSIGMQTSSPKLLKTLGRIHEQDEVILSVETARRCGFHNLNLDLIFGIPGQTMTDWKKTLQDALELKPEHISMYGLIPEEGTPMWSDLEKGVLQLPDPELERDMYDYGTELLAANGFRQYEISNYARPGYECVHNTGYWKQIPYVGLGVSASSMTRLIKKEQGMTYERRKNPDTFGEYLYMIESGGTVQCEKDRITEKEARFETVMLSLRMNEGLDEKGFRRMHHISFSELYMEKLSLFESKGLMIHENGRWRLTRRGMDIQNRILVELMEDG